MKRDDDMCLLVSLGAYKMASPSRGVIGRALLAGEEVLDESDGRSGV